MTRLQRGIEYAAVFRFHHWRLWNTGSPAFAGDDDWTMACFVASRGTVVVRLDRTIQYAAASRLFSGVSGILGRPVKPGDDE
jgi:hypothetical protein